MDFLLATNKKLLMPYFIKTKIEILLKRAASGRIRWRGDLMRSNSGRLQFLHHRNFINM